MDKINIEITDKFSLLTIKEFLKENNVGRGKIEYIRVNKLSLVNDVFMPLETKLQKGDKLSFIIDENIDFVAENKDIDVVYEDEYVLIVNKPINMIIHPDDKSKTGTLVNLVANYYKKKNINRQVRYIHRIDKDTSGLLIVAKTNEAHEFLSEQLKERKALRKYQCIVNGNIKEDTFTINKPIHRHPNDRKRMAIIEGGREAVTHVKILKRFGRYTLVECSLETGRTHQIRVHLSSVGHSIVGDPVYGIKKEHFKTNGQLLHAKTIGFIHPKTKELMQFDSQLPEYFTNILKKLETDN